MNKRSFYYNSLKSQLEHILGHDVGYKKYTEMTPLYVNKIRRLFEIVELREVKHTTPIKTPKDERNELRYALAKQQMFAIYGRQPRNLCKQFRLEDKLQEKSFNIRFSKPENIWVFYSENDLTEDLLIAIKKRIGNISNIIFVIWGPPNSGKSEGGHIIGIFIIYQFEAILNRDVKLQLAYSTPEFSSILREMKDHPGNTGILDEKPGISGFGSKNVEMYLKNVTKAVRLNQNSFIFIDPIEMKPGVVDYYLETAGKWKKEEITRFILYDKYKNMLGHIYLPLHTNEEFRRKYLITKKKNIGEILEHAGMVGVEIDKKRLDSDINKLVKWCMKEGANTKSAILSQIPYVKIKGDINYVKDTVVENAYLKIKKIKNSKKAMKILYNKGNDIVDFVLANLKNKDRRTIAVAEGLLRNDNCKDIEKNNQHLNLTYRKVLTTRDRLDDEFWRLAEKYVAIKYFEVPEEFVDEVVAGNKEESDIDFEGRIGSVKFSCENIKSNIKYRQSEDMKPERNAVGEKGTFEFFYINPIIGVEAQVELGPNSDDEVIIENPKYKMLEL